MTSMKLFAFATLVAAPLFASCHADCKKRNDDLANQVHQTEVELNQAKAERDEARNREENIQRQLAGARDEARVARENAAAQAKVVEPVVAKNEKVDAKNAATTKNAEPAETRELVKKLSHALASSKVTVQEKDGKAHLIVPLGESFNPGSAELNANGKKFVKEVAAALKKDTPAEVHLTIVGYTDSDPIKKAKAKYADNKALSLARAKEVMTEFKAAGISSKRMSAEGMGESDPIAAGTSKVEKAKNRRVEIVID
ncbi:MAG: OmpA family protein [Planctomycetes bacterium]|nr:OmpA family protein [Planctomycetota bacterium]